MSKLSVKLWKDKAFLNGNFQDLRRIALELPGFKKFVNDSLMFEPSGKNVEHLLLSDDIEWEGDAAEIKERHEKRIRNEIILISNKQNPESWNPSGESFKFKHMPFEHQKKAWFLSKDSEYYGYFMEMGTGKTKVIIDNAAYLWEKGKINCLIIVAPNGVNAQWVNEQIPEHMPERIKYEAAIYRASDKNMLKEVEKVYDSKADALKIVAFNIESFSNEKGLKYIQAFLKKFNCMLALDESTRIKTPGSQRTKNAIKLAPLAKYRRIMSGAPVTKGYEDLYAQLKFLHPDVLGFNSFYTFRNYHCIMGGFESRQIVGYRPNAIKELEKRIETYTFRVTKKECLDLPEKVYINRYVELTQEQKDIYKKIEKELEIDLALIKDMAKGGNAIPREVDSALMTAITKMLRMQQVICGHFVVENEDKTQNQIIPVENNRVDVLMECIEEAQGKVIVWSRFVNDIKLISKRMKESKIDHVLYYGEVSETDRDAAIKKFRENPACKVFLAQPASGGTGLNLAVADTVIYYSNDFNADTRWQSEDRAHRIGQKNNVTYIDLIASKTIDEEIISSLRKKKNLADALLDNPRAMIKE